MLKRSTFKRPKWSERNFITEVLIPSLLMRRGGVKPTTPPVFPKLKENEVCVTWIGHASFLVQSAQINVLIDPNWANWLWVIKRLKHAGLEAGHLPDIDLVLITHAHFDHLDRGSLRAVAAHQPIVVPRGVSGLVADLGFEEVREMDWWDDMSYHGVDLVFTPAKHWGARVVTDRHRGYGGYFMKLGERRVYHMGDSAYFEGFAEIGERLRPEIAMIPIGAYQPPSFRDHHISPEQAMDAFVELKAERMVPMHFGTYRMSYEPMHEPPQRLMKEAKSRGLIDQVCFLNEGLPKVF